MEEKEHVVQNIFTQIMLILFYCQEGHRDVIEDV